MADEVRLCHPQFIAEPGDIVCENLHGVALSRLSALSMPSQIQSHHAVFEGLKSPDLGTEIAMVAAPSVDKYKGGIAHFARFKREVHSIALK
jgi:hypothetical protein